MITPGLASEDSQYVKLNNNMWTWQLCNQLSLPQQPLYVAINNQFNHVTRTTKTSFSTCQESAFHTLT